MDDLIEDFSRSLTLSVYDPTPFSLIYQYKSVYTYSYINKGTIIGEIVGKPAYIWEIDHSDYIIIDQDYVLDVSSSCNGRRSVLTLVREENDSNNAANCTIVSTTEDTPRFFLQATTNITPDTELVYYVLRFM